MNTRHIVPVILVAISMGTITSAADAADQPAAQDKRIVVPPGYHLRIVKGEVRYCTKTTTLGSRFPKWSCVDEEGLRALAELRNSNQQDLRRAQSVCASAAYCQIL